MPKHTSSPKARRGPWRVLALVLLAAYVAGGLLFSVCYLPGTRVNGADASLRTPASLARDARSASEDFATHVQGQGIDLSIDAAQVSFAFDEEAFASAAADLLPGWAWPRVALRLRDHSVLAGVSMDEASVRRLVAPAVQAANVGAISPAPATVAYDDGQGAFVAVEQQVGTRLDEDRVLEAVTTGIATLQRTIELGVGVLERPTLSIAHPNIQAAVVAANRMVDLTVDLMVDGTKVATAGTDLVRSWVTLDDDCQVTGDLPAITHWAQNDFSAMVDTVGTRRTYTRPDDGKVIEVEGGTYGWNVDGAQLARVLQSRIEQNSPEPVDVPLKSAGANLVRGGQDWGASYVDVDLSEQWVRMFDDQSNLIWASECVTGNLSLGRDTITGVYAIEDKESPAVLIGLDEDGDGEPDYQSDVDYWMPFCGGYGLHDALWRSTFGGDEHLYNGSHGCVNLPYYAAQSLFGLVGIGDPVVVHW